MMIEVPLADLALALYLPEPSVNYGEPDERGRYANATCNACGSPAGAHYCLPRQEALARLTALTTGALYALPDGVSP